MGVCPCVVWSFRWCILRQDHTQPWTSDIRSNQTWEPREKGREPDLYPVQRFGPQQPASVLSGHSVLTLLDVIILWSVTRCSSAALCLFAAWLAQSRRPSHPLTHKPAHPHTLWDKRGGLGLNCILTSGWRAQTTQRWESQRSGNKGENKADLILRAQSFPPWSKFSFQQKELATKT